MRNPIFILIIIAAMYSVFCISVHGAEDRTTGSAATFEYVGTYGGAISAVRNVGSYTYVGQGSVLRVFRTADCDNHCPKELAHLKMEEPITQIESHGSALLVFTENPMIKAPPTIVNIVNIKNPSKPGIIVLGDSSHNVFKAINGNQLLLRASDEDRIFDISNPLKPVLAFSGREASAKEMDFPLRRDILKENDRLKCDLFAPDFYDVRAKDKIAYLLGSRTLTLVDVTSPDSPRYLSQLSFDTTTTAFDCSNNYLAVSDRQNSVYIYSLSKPMKPTFLKSIPVKNDFKIKASPGVLFPIQEIQIQDKYLCAQLLVEADKDPVRVVVYDVSSSSTQPVTVSKGNSPYNKLYKTGFGNLLKYCIFNEKYWVITYYSGDSESMFGESSIGLVRLSSNTNRKIESASRLSSDFREESFWGVMIEGSRVYAGWNGHDTGGNGSYIDLMIYESGSLSNRARFELPEDTCKFFIQNDIVYSVSGGHSLVMYKVHF